MNTILRMAFKDFDAAKLEVTNWVNNYPVECQHSSWHKNGLQAALAKVTDEASLEAMSNPDGPSGDYEVYRKFSKLMGKSIPNALSQNERVELEMCAEIEANKNQIAKALRDALVVFATKTP